MSKGRKSKEVDDEDGGTVRAFSMQDDPNPKLIFFKKKKKGKRS